MLLVMLATLTVGCGVAELGEGEGPGEGRESYFRHGTPPGPAPWTYMLTSFSGETMACGGYASGWYYSTGAYTFGCGAKLHLEAQGKCVVVQVADNGPAAWVEKKCKSRCGGTGYIIDASPLVSKYLFGSASAGWSDCFAIKVSQVAKSTKTGPVPCGTVPSVPPTSKSGQGFIGDACVDEGDCSTGLCLSEEAGFPQGTCSQPCQSLCPDQPGKALTFCTDVDGQPRCVSRCDTGRYPGSGCRAGYQCVTMPRYSDHTVEREVCLP